MYSRRIKIFIALCLLLLSICLLRLAQLQLLPNSIFQQGLEELKKQKQYSLSLNTLRGNILDRQGRIIATDKPVFQILISYQLSQFADPRVIAAKLLRAERSSQADTALPRTQERLQQRSQQLARLRVKCDKYGISREELGRRLSRINHNIWNIRLFLAWRKECDQSELLQKNKGNLGSVPPAEYISDFAHWYPDPNERLLLTQKQDIEEMHQYWPLLDLLEDEDVINAQFEFQDELRAQDGEKPVIEIVPKTVRTYPYDSAAAQTIGWLGIAQDRDKKLFAQDPSARYLPDEVCGREDGIEYMCEPLLRGRRGQLIYDIDEELVGQVETKFGHNIALTLDIVLQKDIEIFLQNYSHAPHCDPNMAAVVLNVNSGDILALVSLPLYDPSQARYDIGDLLKDPNLPTLNRCLNKHYSPGSTIKPLILVAGLETGKITKEEPISCPAAPAKIRPNCWIWRENRIGHDYQWENNARNAIKGSCNIYFSQLSVRIPPRTLQEWLFKFGYGHQVPLPFVLGENPDQTNSSQQVTRRLRQGSGYISSSRPDHRYISDINEIPDLHPGDRRLAGIGEGQISATVLQIANSMATLARQGMHITPRLFLPETDAQNETSPRHAGNVTDLNISKATMDTVIGGLDAVVNEHNGTAYKAFGPSLQEFSKNGVKIYGKTGSTQKPETALFAGFARDKQQRTLAVTLVVEGGKHGSTDAAPLGRSIFRMCIDAGYLGTK